MSEPERPETNAPFDDPVLDEAHAHAQRFLRSLPDRPSPRPEP